MNPALGYRCQSATGCLFSESRMNKFAKAALAVPASLLALGAQAQEAAFTAAVTSVSTDIAAYGAALVGVAAVGVGFMIGMKYVKKIRGAA